MTFTSWTYFNTLRKAPVSRRNASSALVVALTVILLLRRNKTVIKAEKAIAEDVLPDIVTDITNRRLTKEELAKATAKLYEVDEDDVEEGNGKKKLLVPFRGRIKKVLITPTSPELISQNTKYFPPIPPTHKPSVDRTFLKQLLSILRIAFPKIIGKESMILLLHSFFLVMRTLLSVGVARLDGRIVRDLVSANGKGFLRGLAIWFILAIPSTYTNSMLHHLQSKLSLFLRTRLSRYTHDLYLSASPNLRYYRVGQEGGLEGVDQYITSDIAAWCESLSALYGNALKPFLDLFIFTYQLSFTLHTRGTILLLLNYYLTSRLLRAVSPAFGRLANTEAMLEGEWRRGVARVGGRAEEVAFYDGGLRERGILWDAYTKLIRHVNSIYKLRIAYEWTEDFVIKYIWSAAGYCLIAVPVLITRKRRSVSIQANTNTNNIAGFNAKDGHDVEEVVQDAVASRTEDYISSRRLLLSLADAGGRLMYAYKDVLELAGLTTRLYSLLSTLHNLPPIPKPIESEDKIELKDVDIVVPRKRDFYAEYEMDQIRLKSDLLVSNSKKHSEQFFSNGHSSLSDSGNFSLTPQTTLVHSLSFTLQTGTGEHLMITGTNGVGKTAVARVLAGLWVPGGADGNTLLSESTKSRITRPARDVFVIPQRAYMVVGTLLDQIIYPHTYTQFLASGRAENELMHILDAVHLAYLPEREGGWTTKKEWRDVLSGGEKQRMSMARVFYHKPKFAVLDECTSAVSSDVEGSMYEHAKQLGITLITISLRPSLAKYHTHLLTIYPSSSSSHPSSPSVTTQIDNRNWTLTRVGTAEERMGIDREILLLQSKLAEVEIWERRVKELEVLLSRPEP